MADGQHETGRVIAGRILENGGIGFFVVRRGRAS
jgi:hypothetical protein